jgi:hypothetical protein
MSPGSIGNCPLFAPGEDVGEILADRQRPMKVLSVARFLAETGIVIDETFRQ